ncbi:hypothetical protein SARC_02681 [Sphaeroforma arctica JP610]|uniref:Uncharacterized protein n=1 Tax=Sphaeroforma arctica JP610 TaxID=667725 RepID=A0A0L0G8C5_9EUKA|nr:hypothetical protein SARC_02681 [Sphaeroforma arctica JP610]KNC85126.1 hypothetical protein SARC_02681 [Sphaeroforma arctica JP610]|eukprot:XP_014159028.1 hypothetical protein SARC_02681 [Sphaeroforma arctica JP610]
MSTRKHGYVPTSVDVSAKANCATHLPTSTDTVLSDIRESDDDNRPILDPSAGYYWIVTVRTLSQEPRAASIELLVTLTIEQTQRLLNMEPTEEVCGPNPMSWIVQALPPHTFNEETEAAIAQSTSVEALTPTAKECISTHLTDKRMMFVIECYQGLCEHPEVSLTKAYPLQLVPEGVTDS